MAQFCGVIRTETSEGASIQVTIDLSYLNPLRQGVTEATIRKRQCHGAERTFVKMSGIHQVMIAAPRRKCSAVCRSQQRKDKYQSAISKGHFEKSHSLPSLFNSYLHF